MCFYLSEEFYLSQPRKTFLFFQWGEEKLYVFFRRKSKRENHISNWTLAVWLSDLNCSIAILQVNKFKLRSI